MNIWNKFSSFIQNADKSACPYIYGVVLVMILFVVGGLTYTPPPPPSERDPVALKAKDDLNLEMADMERMPDTNYEEVRNSWKERTFRIVSVRFVSELTYKDIVRHYGRQLEKRGWIYDAVRYYKSEDTGNMYPITFYKKGSYYAKIAYRDEHYYLTFDWWSRDSANRVLQ